MVSPEDFPKARILVVDDEEAIGRMICRSNVDSESFRFSSVTQPAEALEQIKRGECDLLLTDIDMPEMNGYELTEAALRIDPYLPVIALTAHGQDPTVEIRSLQAGARYFLGKPFDNDALLAAIEAIYAQARIERERAGMLLNIRESRDLLQSILDNTSDVVFVKDLELRYIAMNRVGLKMLELTEEEIRGRTDADVFPAPVAETLREADLRVLRLGESVEMSEVMDIGHGEQIFSSKKFPLRDKNGSIWAVCGISRDVTDRVHASQAVEEQLQFLQTLMDTIPALVFHKDLSGEYLGCNQAFAGVWGKSREEVVGAMPEDLLDQRQAESIRAHDRMLLESGESETFEMPLHHADGTVRDTMLSRAVYKHVDGEPAGIVGVGIDITEHKQLESELREKQQMLRSVFSTMPIGICVTDEDGLFVQVNESYCRIYGYSEDELIGKSFLKIVPENDHAWVKQMYASFIQGVGDEVPAEWRLLKKDGEPIDVWVTAGRLRHPDGRCFKVTTVRDITEEKRLRLEREMYFQAFRFAIQGIVITDTKGKIIHANESFASLYGYTIEEVIGKNPRLLNPGREVYRDLGIEEEEYDHLFKQMWVHISDPAIGFWQGDIVNRRKDGLLRWVRLFVSATRDEHGHIIAYTGMPMDITTLRARADSERIEFYHALAELAAARDNETGMHLKRIGTYAAKMAAHLGQSKKYVHDMEVLAPLHDVGKVGIADEILLAPRRLTPEEFEIMKTHTTLGYDIMRGRQALHVGAEIAYGHHEKWDGSGYPQGVSGEEIPLSARIVAVCDVYDALRSERPYKRAWTHEEAADVIREGRGSHFDPRMVDTFFALEEEFKRVSKVMCDEQE